MHAHVPEFRHDRRGICMPPFVSARKWVLIAPRVTSKSILCTGQRSSLDITRRLYWLTSRHLARDGSRSCMLREGGMIRRPFTATGVQQLRDLLHPNSAISVATFDHVPPAKHRPRTAACLHSIRQCLIVVRECCCDSCPNHARAH